MGNEAQFLIMRNVLVFSLFCHFTICHLANSQTITQIFGAGSDQFTMDFVSVGSPSNTADSTSYGAVSYTFNIGKYELSNLQYTKFLNSVAKASDPYGLYNPFMDSGHPYSSFVRGIVQTGTTGNFSYQVVAGTENKPVAFVSWYDAARFVNWLHNGAQNQGNTENGVYSLNGALSGSNFARSQNALFWIPSENEWYKAAYFDSNKNGTGGYWDFPNGSISIDITQANYNSSELKEVNFGTASPSGTYGQGGNLWEWNESDVSGFRPNGELLPDGAKGLRGGSAGSNANELLKTYREGAAPNFEWADTTFRIAGVPEPSVLSVFVIGIGALAMMRRHCNLK